jgi:hypothetical protein
MPARKSPVILVTLAKETYCLDGQLADDVLCKAFQRLHMPRTGLKHLASMYLVCGTIAETLQLRAAQTQFVEITEIISAIRGLEKLSLPHICRTRQTAELYRTISDFLLRDTLKFRPYLNDLKTVRTHGRYVAGATESGVGKIVDTVLGCSTEEALPSI